MARLIPDTEVLLFGSFHQVADEGLLLAQVWKRTFVPLDRYFHERSRTRCATLQEDLVVAMKMRLISKRIQRLVDSTPAGASLCLALWRQSSGFPDDNSGRNRLGALTLEFCSIQGNLSQSRWIRNCDPDDSALFGRPLV